MAARRHTLLLERLDLGEEAREMDDGAVADQARARRVHEPGREQVEREGRAPAPGHVRDDRVSGVVPARAARTDVERGGEDVDELALALVAPLRAEHDGHWRGASVVGRVQRRAARTAHGGG